MSASVVLFARLPAPGRVKTRLAAGLSCAGLDGDGLAARLYAAFLEDCARACLAGCEACGARARVACAEAGEVVALRKWLAARFVNPPQVVAQAEGDLGARLTAIFVGEFADGRERVVAVGSDVPELSPEDLRSALKGLDESDCVLAPAADGGFSLVGFTRAGFRPGVFDGQAWSRADTRARLVEKLTAEGVRVGLLAPLDDVDEMSDLRRAADRGRLGPASRAAAAALGF